MSSNFAGNVRKNAKSFEPRGPGAPDVVVVKTTAGGYEQGGVQYFEPAKKADSGPVLPTDKAPHTDGEDQRELGIHADNIDRDGGAKYLDPKLIQRIVEMADGGDERAKKALEELLALAAEKSASTGTLIKCAGESISVFVPILRKDAALREVHGIIAEEVPDKSGEIFDYGSSEPWFKKWSSEALERTTAAGLPASFGNVRSQHSANAVGKLTSIQFDSANKRIPVVAKIIDDDTWRKIQAGVLTGFSIGGSYLNKWADGNYVRYTAKPAEVSIVDNPCMPGATFSMVKDAPSELDARIAALQKRVDEMLKAQGANSEELSPTRFRNVHEWREAIAKAELAKALANGKPAEFEGGVESGPRFKTLDTGEQPTGTAKRHVADLDPEITRKPFRPRG